MEDKDKHINQQPDSNYPEPSVPATDAWANMNDMLNLEMPVSEATVPGKNILINSLKFILPSIVLVTAGIMFWNYGLDNNAVSKTGLTESNKNLIVKKHEETDRENSNKGFEVNDDLKNSDLNQKAEPGSEIVNPRNKSEITKTLKISSEKNLHSKDNLSENNTEFEKEKNSNPQFNPEKPAQKNELASAILNNTKRVKNSTKIKISTTNKNKNTGIKETGKDYNSLNSRSLPNNSKSSENSNNLVLSGKYVFDKQNVFSSNPANQFLTNKKTLPAGLNDKLENLSEKQINVRLLKAKFSKQENKLKQEFESIVVKNLNVIAFISEEKIKQQNSLLKDIHVGLQWNNNIPLKGYDHYFTGANNKSNQFYTLIIPGLWIEKKLKNGNGVMLKLNPYSQYFGNNKQIISSTTSSSDSLGITKINNATSIIKISGMSGGVQYNQRIYDKLSIGIGANAYWQNRALLNKTVSDSAKIIMSDSLYSVKETSIEGKYLNLYFITANLEVLYTWRIFQFGGGIVIPVTSMTGISDKKIRPVSGQLVFRWRLK